MRNSAKECAICHFRWLDQFYVEGRGTDLVEYQKERVEGSEMICYTCHNGIIVDSRERFWAKRGHACNMKPSKNVRIPPEMPLGEKGEVVCATCHTVHGVSDELRFQETIYLRFSNRNSEMCMLCHVTKVGGKAMGNHPINVKGVTVPQKIYDLYGRVGKDGEIICESCHTVHGTTDKNLLVIPDRIDEKAFTSELCEACHGNNPSRPDKGVGMGTHPVDLLPQIARPPGVWEGGRNVAIGRNGEIICQTCHWPHNAEPQTSILAKKGKTSICLDCHKVQLLVKGTDHDLSLSAPQAINIYGRTVQESGICSPCHIPHNAGGVKLWARKTERHQPAEALSLLCTSCHHEGMPAFEKSIGQFSHPVGKGMDRIGAKTNLPLFDRKGGKSESGMVACSTCHNVHKWDPSKEEQGPGTKKDGDRHNSFLRQADVPAASLCLSCHKDKKAVNETEHDLSISAPKEMNYRGQTSTAGGICSPCHLVHNGTSIKIWARQVDKKDAYITGLCASCHRKGMCAEKKLVGDISHPTEKAMRLEGGNQGIALPQYDALGQRADHDGLISCSSCHDPHQWSPDRNTSGPGKMLEGDERNSFLRIINDQDSSLCVNCHVQKGYLLRTEHDLRITAPKEANALSQTVKKSGLCSGCHVPHQAFDIRLFAKKTETQSNPGVRLCETCHAQKGCAPEKIITSRTHPMSIHPKVPDLKLPLYDMQGEPDMQNGFLACATCHDPHQWNPKALEKGSGKKMEGTEQNSFLRQVAAPEPALCQTCHETQSYVLKTDHDLTLIDPNFSRGTCAACHAVHNGEGYRLWAYQLDPLSSGRGPVDLLCQSCHMANRIGNKKALRDGYSHPVNISLKEKGMKTTHPLYTRPKNSPLDQREDREQGEIMTCATCHNVHQWSEDDKTCTHAANLEGTIATSFLRQTSKGPGYLCLDCHEDKRYVVWSEHDMRLVAPDATNQTGQTVLQGGVCSPCHAVHHARQSNILWARSLEGEKDLMLGTCVNCHKKGGCAGTKDVFIGMHPSSFVYTGKIMEQQQLKGSVSNIYYPLYDKQGNKSQTGFVTCTTCHDPHQWDPVAKLYPANKNIEGDPTNSFLRNRGPAFSICLDCHRLEALLKYKNYHQPSEWQQKYWRNPKKK